MESANNLPQGDCTPVNGRNWRLVTDELVEFKE